MSSNLAVVNFSVGGTLTVSGKITLAETILSSSTASFQGLSTTSLDTTGASTFTSLPTSTQTPTLDSQLTTKVYVDTADTTLDTRITDTDSAQRTYIDTQDTALGKRITDDDTSVRTYIDASYNELNTRVTNTDSTQKTYIDTQDTALDAKINIYGKKGYYIQNGGRVYLESDLGFSQLIELRPSNGQFSFYTTFLPNPTTCSGQIVSIWNNSNEDQGIDQTGDNLFIRNLGVTRVSIFIRTKTVEMFVSSGNNWINFKGSVLQDDN
jgi:hypothetical protein